MSKPQASPGGPTTTGSVSIDVLRSIGLFGALGDEQLEHLAKTLRLEDRDATTVVFREGDKGRAMYVVLDGELAVTKLTTSGSSRLIAELKRGEWFGEMSMLDVMPRPVTVTCNTATQLLRVCPTDLDMLYRRGGKAYALLVMNLARELSRKLRTATKRLAENGG